MLNKTDDQLSDLGWLWAHRSRSSDGSRLLGVTVSASDAALWCREGRGVVISLKKTEQPILKRE
jgi:hypothetical protein